MWLYSPAPQVYAFAKNNDFSGKQVILFNSMNSKFEQRFIDDFKKIVAQNGGTFAKHLYVIHGRMGQQMPTDVFLQEIENRLRENSLPAVGKHVWQENIRNTAEAFMGINMQAAHLSQAAHKSFMMAHQYSLSFQLVRKNINHFFQAIWSECGLCRHHG